MWEDEKYHNTVPFMAQRFNDFIEIKSAKFIPGQLRYDGRHAVVRAYRGDFTPSVATGNISIATEETKTHRVHRVICRAVL